MAHNKPRVDVERNDATSASGIIPHYDEGYLFDDPELFFDAYYPGDVSHSQSQKPKISSENIK